MSPFDTPYNGDYHLGQPVALQGLEGEPDAIGVITDISGNRFGRTYTVHTATGERYIYASSMLPAKVYAQRIYDDLVAQQYPDYEVSYMATAANDAA